MLFAVMQCLSQSEWLVFGNESSKLIDLHTFDKVNRGPLGIAQILLYIKRPLVIGVYWGNGCSWLCNNAAIHPAKAQLPVDHSQRYWSSQKSSAYIDTDARLDLSLSTPGSWQLIKPSRRLEKVSDTTQVQAVVLHLISIYSLRSMSPSWRCGRWPFLIIPTAILGCLNIE